MDTDRMLGLAGDVEVPAGMTVYSEEDFVDSVETEFYSNLARRTFQNRSP